MRNKMEEIEEKLRDAADREGLVELYTRSEDSFSVGSVASLNREGLILREMDGQGRWCGYCFFKLEAVRGVETDTDYLKKLECCLCCWKGCALFPDGCPEREPPFFDPERCALLDLLTGQCLRKHIVTVGYFEEMDLDTGYVLALTDRMVSLKTVDVSSGNFLDTSA